MSVAFAAFFITYMDLGIIGNGNAHTRGAQSSKVVKLTV